MKKSSETVKKSKPAPERRHELRFEKRNEFMSWLDHILSRFHNMKVIWSQGTSHGYYVTISF